MWYSLPILKAESIVHHDEYLNSIHSEQWSSLCASSQYFYVPYNVAIWKAIQSNFFQKSSMNSLKMFHGYVNVVIYGNLTIINQFLW